MTILTNKEKMVVEEEKSHEELCILKYEKALEEACDLELKKLFNSILEHEKEHLKTLNRILSGDIPDIEKESKEKTKKDKVNPDDSKSIKSFNKIQLNMFQNKMKLKMGLETANELTPEEQKENDYLLCQDALVGEKFVSSTYNNSIFECLNSDLRKVLNHIQKDEQEHGEQITNYLLSQGLSSH